MDFNNTFVCGLSRNLFHILQNILIVVGITYRDHSSECRIYVQFIITNLLVVLNNTTVDEKINRNPSVVHVEVVPRNIEKAYHDVT